MRNRCGSRRCASVVSTRRNFRDLERAKEIGAACLTAKVTETIKRVEGDKIAETIDRETLRRALTPQCFKIEILQAALKERI